MPRPVCRMRLGIALGFVALWLGGPVSPSAAAEGVHASRWIAEDAAIYLEMTRPARWLDWILDEEFRKALTELPGVERFYQSEASRQAVAGLEAVTRSLGVTWEQGLRDLTGGGLVFAVEGKPARMILVVTPTDPAFLNRLNRTLLDKVREAASSKGRDDPIKSGEYRGITGYEWGSGKGAYAIVAEKLVIADRAKTLRDVIDRVLDGTKSGASLADHAGWKARRALVPDDAQAWGLVRLDRLRELNPKRFAFKGTGNLPATLLFGSWLEAVQKADWASGALTWTESGPALQLELPAPPGGYRAPLKGFIPPRGQGAKPPITPPGTLVSLSLWRDLESLWEARAELLPPEAVQGLAKLDGVAGQFFGGRDFGTGVLGALGDDWRLVVARQDHSKLTPIPALKLPAFALIVDVNADDKDFSQRLKVAFQSIVGVSNLAGAQSKSPPLELGSETFEGVPISTARYMRPQAEPETTEPVHPRHNFSPSIAQVDDHFILSSTVGLARDLIHALKTPVEAQGATLLAEADGAELAGLIELNKPRLVMQNMLEEGHDKAQAEQEIGLLAEFLRDLGHARLSIQDTAEALRLNLTCELGIGKRRAGNDVK